MKLCATHLLTDQPYAHAADGQLRRQHQGWLAGRTLFLVSMASLLALSEVALDSASLTMRSTSSLLNTLAPAVHRHVSAQEC